MLLENGAEWQLHVSEILNEVAIPRDKRVALDAAIEALRSLQRKPAGKTKQTVAGESERVWFQWFPPEEVVCTGGWALNAALSPEADVLVSMPAEAFGHKDYLNRSWSIKTKMYLIESAKKAKLQVVDVYPTRLRCKTATGEQINLIASIAPEAFTRVRFRPGQNNIRSIDGPTPQHNNQALRHLCLAQNTKQLLEIFELTPNYAPALLLFKIWLKQRECTRWSFLGAYLFATLHKTNMINGLMLPFQVFKTALGELKNEDWLTNPAYLTEVEPKDRLTEWATVGIPLRFADFAGEVNLLSDFLPGEYKTLKALASDSLVQANIEWLLLRSIPLPLSFDFIACIHIPVDEDADNGTFAADAALFAKLERALEGRINFCCPISRSGTSMTIGVSLSAGAYEPLTKGPAGNTSDAAEFRNFWGSLSQLRRFRDGEICEAVLWPSSNVAECRRIPAAILCHFHPDAEVLSLEKYICLAIKHGELGTGEELRSVFNVAYNEFTSLLRRLKLTLPANKVQGVSESYRMSEVLPTPFFKSTSAKKLAEVAKDKVLPHFVPVHEVLLILEGSSSWPQHYEAVRRVKAALVLELATALAHQCVARVTIDTLDVCYQGFVFRVRMAAYQEVASARRVIEKSGLRRREDSVRSEALVKELDTKPRTSAQLRAVALQYPIYGATAALFKRWLASQLLLDYFDPLVLDALVAAVFLGGHSLRNPMSPEAGFMQVLHLLVHHDWRLAPLYVNLNEELTLDQRKAARKGVAVSSLDRPAMFLCQPHDHMSKLTQEKPPLLIFNRTLALAAKALKQLSTSIDSAVVFTHDTSPYDFIIHLNIRCLPRLYQALKSHGIGGVAPVPIPKPESSMPVVDMDPQREYVKYLREAYGKFGYFFSDVFGGDFVAVLLKPLRPKPFQTKELAGQRPQAGDCLGLELDIDAFETDLKMIGGSLVTEVTRRKGL